MRISVLTLNLWNINEPLAARFAALAAGLKQLRPDIVCLQEVARDPRSGRRQSDLVAQMCDIPHVIDNERAVDFVPHSHCALVQRGFA